MASEIGRPTDCTPEVQEAFVQAIRLGCDIIDCCGVAGITKTTYYRWRQWAEDGRQPFRDFCDAVDRAEATGSQARMSAIHMHAEKDWRALAWVQEHRFPDRYGKRQVELTGKDGGAVQVATSVVVLPGKVSVDDWVTSVNAAVANVDK